MAETIRVSHLLKMFPTEESCVKWLEQCRWGGVATCPHCGFRDDISRPRSKPDYYWYGNCRVRYNVRTNTPLHATKKPLREWMYVIYSVLTARKGVSACAIEQGVGLPVPDGLAHAAPRQGGLRQRAVHLGERGRGG